jgi:hypothetical protein
LAALPTHLHAHAASSPHCPHHLLLLLLPLHPPRQLQVMSLLPLLLPLLLLLPGHLLLD